MIIYTVRCSTPSVEWRKEKIMNKAIDFRVLLCLLAAGLALPVGAAAADNARHLEAINWHSAVNDARWADDIAHGAGWTIAVLDSGIAPDHAAFDGRSIDGFNFVDDPLPPLEEPDWRDGDGHGSAVASVAAGNAADFDGTATGGIARQADLLSLRIADNHGDVELHDANDALEWLIDDIEQNGRNVAAVNLSFATSATYDSPDQSDAGFDGPAGQLWDLGVAVVAAAGNEGDAQGLSKPAISERAIAVGASEQSGVLWSDSNRGEYLNVLAPGVDIPAADADVSDGQDADEYTEWIGTSFSTAVVSGAIPLIYEVHEARWGEIPDRELLLDFIEHSGNFITDDVTGASYPHFDLHAAIERAYLVPEPATMGLLAVGGLALLNRRKR